MQPTRIDVSSAARTYPVFVAHGLVDEIGRWLTAAGVGEQRLFVSSPTVWKRHGETLTAALPGVEHLLVPDGERSKTLQTVARIYESLIRTGADRQSTIIAVGGGVIGDTVGFAAATYLRGVDLVHVPTTLLAQVDSAIGGKVGVNHPLGKNLIGAFHAPVAVIAGPPAAGHLAETRAPRRSVRGGQIRGHLQPHPIRPARSRPPAHLRARTGCHGGHRGGVLPDQGGSGGGR